MIDMDCYKVRRNLAAYCEGGLSPGERQDICVHLAGCRNCTSLSLQFLRMRAALRALPVLVPPPHLATSLRVLASHAQARRISAAGVTAMLAHWGSRTRFWVNEMMRPVALPLAGGLVSAMVLFALLAPNLAPKYGRNIADVPTMLSAEATFVGMGPFGFADDEVTVDVTVDGQGRMVDYSTPEGQAWVKNPGARRSVENALLFAEFSPGTTFGTPAFAKIRITLRRSQIDIKG